MRLYRIDQHSKPGSRWAGTQAEAKAVAKEFGGKWVETDVPTDKAGLLEFLNREAAVARETAALNEQLAAPAPYVSPPKQPAFNQGQPAPGREGGPRLFTAGPDNDLICEAIEEAEGMSLARFAESVACRFASLAKKEAVHA